MSSGAGLAVLDIRIFGLPVPQGRPRARAFQHQGATRVSVYDPATSRDWKRTVLAQVLPQKPAAPVEGPLVMALTFFLPRPKTLPRREHFHVKRPDCSNLLKAVEDALNGIVYRDDSQIVKLDIVKEYSPAPGVQIRIERAVTPAAQGALAGHNAEGR
jgi:Holliday junction resolvase RusA-like endonuclease